MGRIFLGYSASFCWGTETLYRVSALQCPLKSLHIGPCSSSFKGKYPNTLGRSSPSLLLLLMWTRPMDSPSLPLLLRRNKMTIFSLFCPPPSPLRGATVLLSAAFHWAHVGVLGEGWDSGRASTERSKSILAFRKVNGKSGLTLERCFVRKKKFSFEYTYLILLSVFVFCIYL